MTAISTSRLWRAQLENKALPYVAYNYSKCLLHIRLPRCKSVGHESRGKIKMDELYEAYTK